MAARLRGRMTIHASKKGSEKVLGRVLGKGFQKGFSKQACYCFYSKKGPDKGFLEGFVPEGAQNTLSESTTPQACTLL